MTFKSRQQKAFWNRSSRCSDNADWMGGRDLALSPSRIVLSPIGSFVENTIDNPNTRTRDRGALACVTAKRMQRWPANPDHQSRSDSTLPPRHRLGPQTVTGGRVGVRPIDSFQRRSRSQRRLPRQPVGRRRRVDVHRDVRHLRSSGMRGPRRGADPSAHPRMRVAVLAFRLRRRDCRHRTARIDPVARLRTHAFVAGMM